MVVEFSFATLRYPGGDLCDDRLQLVELFAAVQNFGWKLSSHCVLRLFNRVRLISVIKFEPATFYCNALFNCRVVIKKVDAVFSGDVHNMMTDETVSLEEVTIAEV